MNEKDGAIRDASVLGVPKMLILGLQHMFAMFGATILVPILVNSYFGEDVLHVQVTLICAGIGTLFFHLCSKFKVPAFLGSSFAFLGGFATIANMDSGVFADMSNADKLSYACGGIVVAGLLSLILALIIIGALNWGLIGFFRYDLVAAIFGGQLTAISRIVYALVGLSGIWAISLLFRHRHSEAELS